MAQLRDLLKNVIGTVYIFNVFTKTYFKTQLDKQNFHSIGF